MPKGRIIPLDRVRSSSQGGTTIHPLTPRRVVDECIRLAQNVYGDEVGAHGTDEPKAVGEKIAAAIRQRFDLPSDYLREAGPPR